VHLRIIPHCLLQLDLVSNVSLKIIKQLIDMRINVYIWIAFFFLLVCCSCDLGDNRLKIVNNSDTNIYIYYSCDSSLNDLKIFRNGYSKDNKGDSTYTISDEFVNKDSFIKVPRLGHNSWPRFLSDCNEKTLYVFFFSDSIVCKYSDYELKQKRIFNKFKSVSYDSLKTDNWTIVYP
jgi:hypothetical protein